MQIIEEATRLLSTDFFEKKGVFQTEAGIEFCYCGAGIISVATSVPFISHTDATSLLEFHCTFESILALQHFLPARLVGELQFIKPEDLLVLWDEGKGTIVCCTNTKQDFILHFEQKPEGLLVTDMHVHKSFIQQIATNPFSLLEYTRAYFHNSQ